MKAAYFIFVVAAAIALSDASLKCEHGKVNVPDDWIDMQSSCVGEMRRQIEEELKASMQYLAMGAHFSQDVINRPGFAKLFFEASSEEREHAIKLISYLLMRGEFKQDLNDLIKPKYKPVNTTWDSGLAALKDALRLEAKVTKSIRTVIKACEDNENFNDYHLVDYLTGEFLEEQYHGQRDLAGKISTLDKMHAQHGVLGEFLYDKQLLA